MNINHIQNLIYYKVKNYINETNNRTIKTIRSIISIREIYVYLYLSGVADASHQKYPNALLKIKNKRLFLFLKATLSTLVYGIHWFPNISNMIGRVSRV